MDDQNVKSGMDSLMFAIESHTLQTYLGIQLMEMTLIACSLADKNMLSIQDIQCLSRVIAQVLWGLIRRGMIYMTKLYGYI